MTEHQVSLTVPADGAYVSLLRTTTAGLAARLDFTLDGIEDLRMAVDEACALLLPQTGEGDILICGFRVADNELTIDVTVPAQSPQLPSQHGFAWVVLTALTNDVRASVDDRSVTLTLTRQREDTSYLDASR